MRMRAFTKSCAALVLGSVFMVSLAAAANMPAEKQPVKDSWLTAKTKIALFADDRVKGREVNVETKQAKVFLRGKVDSAEAKMAAEEIAKGVEGVAAVKNELQIVAPTKRKMADSTDDAITNQVKRHLAQDKFLKKADIDVKTNAGVVSLSGEVNDLSSSAKASFIAWKVPGVKSVKNDITVKEPAA